MAQIDSAFIVDLIKQYKVDADEAFDMLDRLVQATDGINDIYNLTESEIKIELIKLEVKTELKKLQENHPPIKEKQALPDLQSTSTNEDAAPINLVDYMNSLHIDVYDQWWYRASHVIENMGYRWQGRNSLTGVPKTEIKYIKSTRSLYVSKPYALRLLLLSKSKKVNKVIISFCKRVCQTSESAQEK